MKKVTAFLSAGIIISSLGCSNNTTEKTADETKNNATIAFKAVVVKHTVADFTTWKTAYDAHDSIRRAAGIQAYKLGRGMEDSNSVVIIMKTDDFQKAKDFAASPDLKSVMQAAGVTSAPEFHYLNVLRNDDSEISYADRVMVMHKVKDFDAWLKVYDGEGKATREANGLLDRGLAQDADDPTIVYIVFAITDMAKAQARMQSDDLKKIMTDAGVEGPPTFSFYRLVN